MSIPLIVILAATPSSEPASLESYDASWARLDPALAPPAAVQDDPTPRATDRDPAVFYDEDAWYLRLSGGLVTTEADGGPGEEIDFNEGTMIALAFGRHFGAEADRVGFDVEAEAVWTDQDTDGDIAGARDFNTIGGLINGQVDVRLVQKLFFYGAAGLGLTWVDVGFSETELGDFSEDDGPYLTWQLKAGFQWKFDQDWGLNLGYRFININDIEINDEVGTENFDLGSQQHVLELGLTYSF